MIFDIFSYMGSWYARNRSRPTSNMCLPPLMKSLPFASEGVIFKIALYCICKRSVSVDNFFLQIKIIEAKPSGTQLRKW